MDPDKTNTFAEGLTGSATLGVGQFCTNPGIVFHPGGEWGEGFITTYAENMQKVAVCPMLHQGIKDAYEAGLKGVASCDGVEVVLRTSTEGYESDAYAGPALLLRTTGENFL